MRSFCAARPGASGSSEEGAHEDGSPHGGGPRASALRSPANTSPAATPCLRAASCRNTRCWTRCTRRIPTGSFPAPLDVSDRQSILEARREVERHADHLDAFVSDAAYMGGPENSRIRGPEPIDPELLCKSVRVNRAGRAAVRGRLPPAAGPRPGEAAVLHLLGGLLRRPDAARRRLPLLHEQDGAQHRGAHAAQHALSARLLLPALSAGMDAAPEPGRLPAHSATRGRSIRPSPLARAMPLFTGTRPDEERLELVDYLGSIWPF